MNFKKITSVIACTALLGSTLGFATAATYPAPFVENGAANVAVVYGSTADLGAATTIGNDLSSKVTTGAATTVSGQGDKVKLEKSSVKLHLGDTISDVWGTSLTKADLPTLLSDETFRNKQNDEYKYTQKLDLGALNFTFFSDTDFNNRVPTLGMKLAANTYVMNYTIDFSTKPESSHGTDLADFENKNIKILGKDYYILDFKNSTAKMTLLDAATSGTVTVDAPTTMTVGDKSYTVVLTFAGSDQAILSINGEATEKLSATGTTYGSTYKLNDGTYVGIKSINVNDYAGGTKSVDFSLGKGKLEITDGNVVKLNDKNINDITGYITLGTSGSKRTLNKLVLTWRTDDKEFLTAGTDLVMPGFEAVKLVMEEPTVTDKELTTLEYYGDDVLQIKASVKDGSVTLPLLQFGTSTGNVSLIGKSGTQRLQTANGTAMTYNATSGFNDGFIVSWANSKDSESYYLKAKISRDTTTGINKTTITNKLTDEDVCVDYYPGGPATCNIGNVVLTIGATSSVAGGDSTVALTVNSGGSFNKLYTKDGLKVYLPFDSVTDLTNVEKGGINISSPANNLFMMWFAEADRDGTLGSVPFAFNVTSSGTTTKRVTISAKQGRIATDGGTGSTTDLETAQSSKIWESYLNSELATKILWDKTNSDQYWANLEYHKQELKGNIYVAAPSVTSASSSAIVPIKDSEAAGVTKNLIVVGGSCINTVAAELLGSTTPLCGADFTAKTGVGADAFLIETFSRAGATAVLVAGYELADTAKAANALVTEKPEITVGKKYTGNTASGAIVAAA